MMLASRMVEGGALDVVGLDAADETRDVDAGGTGLEAGRVEAEIAAAGLNQGQLAVERWVQLVESGAYSSGASRPARMSTCSPMLVRSTSLRSTMRSADGRPAYGPVKHGPDKGAPGVPIRAQPGPRARTVSAALVAFSFFSASTRSISFFSYL